MRQVNDSPGSAPQTKAFSAAAVSMRRRIMLDDAAIADADRNARKWTAADSGPIRRGSQAHKTAFCRMLLDTHNPYKPSIIDWPELDSEARNRLVSLPIWDIAVQTEGKARLRVVSYGEAISDPLLQRAIELDGFEEGRHKEVLSNLVRAYGIRLAPEPVAALTNEVAGLVSALHGTDSELRRLDRAEAAI